MSESLILAFERPSQGNPVPYIYVHWSNGYSELQEWMQLAKTFFGCLPLDSDISYAFARLVGLICVKRGIDKTTGVGVGITDDPEFGVDVFFGIFGEQEKIAGRFPSCKLWFFRRPYGKKTIVDFDIDWDVGYYSEYEDEYNHEVNLTELGGDDFANKLGILETSLAKDLAKKLAKKLDTYFDYVIKENCLCI